MKRHLKIFLVDDLRPGFRLPAFHPAPVVKSINIITKKHEETRRHRQIREALHGCQGPKRNQNDIICGISDCIERAAAEHQIRCKKAGGDRYGTHDQICRMKIFEDKIKNTRDDHGGKKDPCDFTEPELRNLHLCFAALIRMAQPCND